MTSATKIIPTPLGGSVPSVMEQLFKHVPGMKLRKDSMMETFCLHEERVSVGTRLEVGLELVVVFVVL